MPRQLKVLSNKVSSLLNFALIVCMYGDMTKTQIRLDNRLTNRLSKLA